MKKLAAVIAVSVIMAVSLAACGGSSDGGTYTVRQIDLSAMPSCVPESWVPDNLKYLYEQTVIDDGADYMAHPDSVLLTDNTLLTMYPEGHGKGAVLTRKGTYENGKVTYSDRLTTTPDSWKKSMETPTVYRLGERTDLSDPFRNHLVMISANTSWNKNLYGHGWGKGDGFNASLSVDNGETWSEFEIFHGYEEDTYVDPIVAMASLTRLKENGKFTDKWMGLFHDYDFYNYKSILTIENGKMVWSAPEKYFADYRKMEKNADMCEVEVIRSDEGKGDQLMLLARSNSKKRNSLMSLSDDEGVTWSAPVEVPAALNGERHKAEWVNGKLFITFRSIERDKDLIKQYGSGKFYSEGWVAWVGSYQDIVNGDEGEYRIKLAHTYLDKQSSPERGANSDTGYCGNVVLPDGTIITSSYGKFDPAKKGEDGELKTFIISKTLRLQDVEKLLK